MNNKFKQTEIGKIPEDWEIKPLDDVATISRGASPRPIHNFISSIGIPWVKISDATAQNTRYISWTNEYILEQGRKNTVIVHPGDLIVSNSATPGIPKFMKISAGIHDGWLLIKPKDRVNKEFLYYVFINERTKLVGIADGTVFRNLKTDIVRNHQVIFPKSLIEQQSIASILSSLDNKIELNQKMNKTLEAIGQALFKRWFVDFEFPDENGNPYKSSGGEMVESELGKIPKGWRIGKLGDDAEITIGRTPPRMETQWFSVNPNDIKWISIKDMGNSSVYAINSSEYLTREAVEKFKIPLIKKNTVIMSFKLTLGRVCITNEDLVSNEAIAHINTKNNLLTPEYLYYYLKNLDYSKLGSTSSIATAINSQMIKRIPLLTPNEEVLKNFKDLTDRLLEKIRLNSIEIESLSSIRDSLLPKLMSGEIRVKGK